MNRGRPRRVRILQVHGGCVRPLAHGVGPRVEDVVENLMPRLPEAESYRSGNARHTLSRPGHRIVDELLATGTGSVSARGKGRAG